MRHFTLALLTLLLCLTPRAQSADETPDQQEPLLIHPTGLALDRNGNLFISDTASHRILKLDQQGHLTPIAGTGHPGFSGDGAPATEARLNSPTDLTFDLEGNLLIADTFNHRIRRIDTTGVITTIVGNGKSDYSTKPAPANEVSLNNPQSLSHDRDGNLYIADTYNHVVRRLDQSSTVTTFAGTEAGLAGDKGPAIKAQLNLPQAVAVAPDGSVYISDAANSRIRRVGPDGIIHTIAGSGPGSGEGGAGFAGDGGPAEKARLFSPADLKFNPLGQLYISDTGNNRIRLITHGTILTIAAPTKSLSLNTPQKLALSPDGSVYIADRPNHRILKLDPQGTLTTLIATPNK